MLIGLKRKKFAFRRTVINWGGVPCADPQTSSCTSDPSITASRTEFHSCSQFFTCGLQSVHCCLPPWTPAKAFLPSPWFLVAHFPPGLSNASLCPECHSAPPLSDCWNPIQLLSLSLSPPSCPWPGILLYTPQNPQGHHLALLPPHPQPEGDVITSLFDSLPWPFSLFQHTCIEQFGRGTNK